MDGNDMMSYCCYCCDWRKRENIFFGAAERLFVMTEGIGVGESCDLSRWFCIR